MANDAPYDVREPPAAHPDRDALVATRLVALIRIAATGPVDQGTDDRVHRLARDLIRDLADARRYERAAERIVEAYERLEPYEEVEIEDSEPPRGAAFGRVLQLVAVGVLLVVALGVGGLLLGEGQAIWATPLLGVAVGAVWVGRRAWRGR